MSTLKTLIIALSLISFPVAAQIALQPKYKMSNQSEHDKAVLECFKRAPWVDNDHWLDRCIEGVQK
jgi:hypothetical protein